MGNNESLNWQKQYEPVEELSDHRLRVRHKANPSQTYELCSIYLPSDTQEAFQARVRQRQKDRNMYIQRLVHCGKGEQDGFCGNNQRYSLLFRESKPSLADHCRSRRARQLHFSPEEICYVIRSVCLGLSYLKGVRESHGSVSLTSISTNQQITLSDPIIATHLEGESSSFKREISGFPSPQKLREYYDVLVNMDQHSSDLFSLGATALQMHYLSRDVREIYSLRNTSYNNTYVNLDLMSQLITGVADNRLREWVWTLMHPDERARTRIYELINNYQVDVKKLKILKENPLKLKPEEELLEQIEPYVESEQLNKNSLVRENLLKRNESLNGLSSNRASLMMPMPISHQKPERVAARPTLANALSSDSLVKFNNPIALETIYSNHPPASYNYATEASHSILKGKVTNPLPLSQNYSKPLQKSSTPFPSINYSTINQTYSKIIETSEKPIFPEANSANMNLQELSDSLRKLSLNLKSFIESQSQQLSWKRENLVVYDVDSFQHLKSTPAAPPPSPSPPPPPPLKRLQIRKATSLYTDKLVPIIPEVQEEHSNLTQSEYVIEQYEIGTKYEGFKRNGKRNGTGKFFYSEGSCYDGEWRDNKMHGFGVLTYPNGALAYQGHWTNDEFHGKGVLYNDDPVPIPGMLDPKRLSDVEEVWIMYEGEMENGRRNGQGKLTFINGEYFEGEFRNDEITGLGEFFSLKGSKLSGRWASGQLVEAFQ